MVATIRMAVIATALAIIPTIGSQGVGTLSVERGHVDAALFGGADDGVTAALLARADAAVLGGRSVD